MPGNDPIGLPGLAALAVGVFVFALALIGARLRGLGHPPDPESKSDPRSVIGFVLQAVAGGMVAVGPIDAALDPLSPLALASAAIILGLMLAAAALFHWSSQTMGRNWALVARARGDASLVTSGPFAYVRNPIYVALALAMIALAIAFGHGRMLVVAVPFYALATWMRVALEEKVLRAQFGADYDAYAARVNRFVPGIF